LNGETLEAYITDLSVFLPNEPVTNEAIEDVLGRINGHASRTRGVILRSNKIKTRHYALDPKTGKPTHTNAQMTALAVRGLKPSGDFDLQRDVDCLACGSTSPDLLNPGLASMVHGELGLPPLEVASTQGICLSGITAFKYALMNVALGLKKAAVACGSELASTRLRASFYTSHAPEPSPEEVERKPQIGFDADFLRWMLSDGAGAALLEPKPRPGQLNLRVDWLEQFSFANELPTCMYIGGRKEADGSMSGWATLDTLQQAVDENLLAIRQDVELLNREILRVSTTGALAMTLKKHPMTPDQVDWLLPHYSSNYFRDRLHEHMRSMGFEIPQERWYTNLERKGNTGAASIFIIMEELFHSGKLKPGQTLLCYIPESGRFSIGWMHLTVV
jgi:3-oxoacyl-[acyl-carrier-protein] synthase-3